MPWRPSVSIVMPVYNGQTYLKSAINSVLRQSFTDFELICVDDGSTDRSPRILAAMAKRDCRIRIVTQPNAGLPAALNRGFAEAVGHLHSWTSDDNMLRPNMLATLVEALKSKPDSDIVYAGYTVIDAQGRFIRYQPPANPEERLFTNPVGAAFLYRREVTRALGGYDETLSGAEDYDFWLRAARQFTMTPVHQDLYLYRRHAASMTDTRMKRIKSLVARLILRETQLIGEPELRARALMVQLRADTLTFRCKLLQEAWKAHRMTVVRQLPQLSYHIARTVKHRIRPGHKLKAGRQS
ncbi:glycosyltransferase family 2 protein [Sphingomonas lacunae]|nr:glycosyltransferase [Sphingomonas lacunae]